jgi:hypothetical protein
MSVALAIGLPAGAIAAVAGIDGQAHSRSYRADWTLEGDRVIVEIDRGKLGLAHGERIVGYYLAGEPRAIGFGCEGAREPVIAMEAADLPRCKRVAPIEGVAK